MAQKKTDLIIAGGGLVGATLACALRDHLASITVIDPMPLDRLLSDDFDGRTTAVSYGSRMIMQGIGVWKDLEPFAEPIHDIRVSDEHAPFYLHYDQNSAGGHPMGFIIENRHLRRVLYEYIQKSPSVTWVAGSGVKHAEEKSSHMEVYLTSGERIRTPLLVAADGKNSKLRGLFDLTITSWAYDQAALVCLMHHDVHHQNIAHEHFTPLGPFAALPMHGGHQSSVVWSIKKDFSQHLMDMNADDFSHAMQDAFGNSLGTLSLHGQRWHFPLSVQFAHHYIRPRFCLVGDAAHSIHPIAGQGLNMGLRDIAVLAEKVVDHRRLGLDIGSLVLLKDYQQCRRFDNMNMIMFTDTLTRAYSNSNRPIRALRRLGMSLIHNLPFVKERLVKQAMGVAGSTSKLVDGHKL